MNEVILCHSFTMTAYIYNSCTQLFFIWWTRTNSHLIFR